MEEIDRLANMDKPAERRPPGPPRKEAAKPNPPQKSSAADQPSSAPSTESATDGTLPVGESPAPTADGSSQSASSTVPPEATGKPVKAAELRSAYETLKQKTASLERELTTLRAKPAAEDPDKKVLLEKVTTLEAHAQKMAEQLRILDFEQDPEFKSKYEKPVTDAYTEGRHKVSQFSVNDGDGSVRRGVERDFDEIMQIGDEDAAWDKAIEKFGQKASAVMSARDKVHEAYKNKVAALDENKKTVAERFKTRSEQQAQQRAQMEANHKAAHEAFLKLNADIAEKLPTFFKPIDGDDEGNEILKKGFEMADRVFMPSTREDPRELLKLHTLVRNKAAGFDRQVHLNKKLRAELEAANAKVAEYEASQPNGGLGRKPSGPGPGLSFEEEIDKMAK